MKVKLKEIFFALTVAALYHTAVELENLMRTNRQTENSITEATLIPVDRRGERANINLLLNVSSAIYNQT